ncbi:MAG TPA: hypothetical protein EYO73_08735 [Sulfurimonas sp.]|nr:hypothetical protein [Sulfurimonas sp.]
MKQEIYCYINGHDQKHVLNLEGSFQAEDILASLVMQISMLKDSTPRGVLHQVSGKLQVMINMTT